MSKNVEAIVARSRSWRWSTPRVSRDQVAQFSFRTLTRADRFGRTHVDHVLKMRDGFCRAIHRGKDGREPETRAHFRRARRVHRARQRTFEQRLPRGGACSAIVKVRLADFGDALKEERIVRIASVEPLEKLQCLGGVLFVPKIDQMELKIG